MEAWLSQSSPTVRIPSRAFEHVWAFYACFATSIPIGPEVVSARAVEIGGLNCKSIASLIGNHKAARQSIEPIAIVDHANLRGPDCFH